jgi:hypothetical protein
MTVSRKRCGLPRCNCTLAHRGCAAKPIRTLLSHEMAIIGNQRIRAASAWRSRSHVGHGDFSDSVAVKWRSVASRSPLLMKLDGLPLPQNHSPGEIETELGVSDCARGMKLVHDLCVSRSTPGATPSKVQIVSQRRQRALCWIPRPSQSASCSIH